MTTRDAEAIARRVVWEQKDQWVVTVRASTGNAMPGIATIAASSVDHDALAQLIVDELRPLQKPKKGKRK